MKYGKEVTQVFRVAMTTEAFYSSKGWMRGRLFHLESAVLVRNRLGCWKWVESNSEAFPHPDQEPGQYFDYYKTRRGYVVFFKTVYESPHGSQMFFNRGA